jgi:carbon-monoxide dehydrogenase medium subunit
VGGSIAHADPASDLPAALIALGAELVLRSPGGERRVPVDGFFRGAFATDLGRDELLVEIRLPAARDAAGSAYVSLQQPASGYAMVGVAAVVITGSGGVIERAGIGVTGVSDHPYRAAEVEARLSGTTGSPEDVAAAAALVVGGRQVNGDIHADPAYRAAMAAVIARRAITAALARAG